MHGIPPAVSGPDGRILPAPGTNEITYRIYRIALFMH